LGSDLAVLGDVAVCRELRIELRACQGGIDVGRAGPFDGEARVAPIRVGSVASGNIASFAVAV
jgi:hypothetical protein